MSADIVVRVLLLLAGVSAVFLTLGSAVRTVILPRAMPARLTRFVFVMSRAVFNFRAGPKAEYEKRDRIMANYAPVTLVLLVLVWLLLALVGYAGIFGALGLPWREALSLSGSSLVTLGIVKPQGLPGTFLAFSEAALGLLLLALLITFLPHLYSNFSKRETLVALLEVRAGSPPSAEEMLLRFWRIHGLEKLTETWPQWEVWFAELSETHTSFPALVFFRSPQPKHSWITAAGTVLDAAALKSSAIDVPRDPSAELCIRSGYVALRAIASYFGITYDPNPRATDPISIDKSEFEEVCDRLAQAGVPLKADLEQAWRDFAGWRVNYDRVLVILATLTMAPTATWSSDRSMGDFRPRLLLRSRS